MKRLRVLAMVLIAAASAHCGNGTLEYGGDRDNTKTVVTIRGTLDDVIPVTTRDIVVFAFTNLRDPGVFQDFDDGETVVIAAGSSEFSIADVDSGDITVVFLLDDPGNEADGQIDDGDPIATLADPDGRSPRHRHQLHGRNVDQSTCTGRRRSRHYPKVLGTCRLIRAPTTFGQPRAPVLCKRMIPTATGATKRTHHRHARNPPFATSPCLSP